MGRTIKKQFWLNSKEAESLRRNAEKTCLTENGAGATVNHRL